MKFWSFWVCINLVTAFINAEKEDAELPNHNENLEEDSEDQSSEIVGSNPESKELPVSKEVHKREGNQLFLQRLPDHIMTFGNLHPRLIQGLPKNIDESNYQHSGGRHGTVFFNSGDHSISQKLVGISGDSIGLSLFNPGQLTHEGPSIASHNNAHSFGNARSVNFGGLIPSVIMSNIAELSDSFDIRSDIPSEELFRNLDINIHKVKMGNVERIQLLNQGVQAQGVLEPEQVQNKFLHKIPGAIQTGHSESHTVVGYSPNPGTAGLHGNGFEHFGVTEHHRPNTKSDSITLNGRQREPTEIIGFDNILANQQYIANNPISNNAAYIYNGHPSLIGSQLNGQQMFPINPRIKSSSLNFGHLGRFQSEHSSHGFNQRAQSATPSIVNNVHASVGEHHETIQSINPGILAEIGISSIDGGKRDSSLSGDEDLSKGSNNELYLDSVYLTSVSSNPTYGGMLHNMAAQTIGTSDYGRRSQIYAPLDQDNISGIDHPHRNSNVVLNRGISQSVGVESPKFNTPESTFQLIPGFGSLVSSEPFYDRSGGNIGYEYSIISSGR